MKAEKTAESGDFLKAQFVKEHKITELKIDDARTIEYVEFTNKDKSGKEVTVKKIQCQVIYTGKGKEDPSTWTMNHKSSNALIEAWGDDTDQWVNKKIPIQLAGEGEYVHIKVDEMRIE